MKIIFSGLESSGKSLKLAMVAGDILWRNYKWLKRSGVARPIVSNMKFSGSFEAYAAELGIPVRYWRDTDGLVGLSDCDVFIDEVGNYFDSRLWSELSLDVRRWLTQGAKMGIELYGAAQDFAQVDKSFRRLVNHLYIITKVVGSRRPSATKPPVRWIWGLCFQRELDPSGYDEDDKKFKGMSSIPSVFLISRRYCEIFDTLQRIERSAPAPFRHVLRVCEYKDDEKSPCYHQKLIHA